MQHNWKNKEEYKYLIDCNDKEVWAWEFLRRNTEYQTDYEDFINAPDFDELTKSPDSLEVFKSFIFEPGPVHAVTYKEYLIENKNNSIQIEQKNDFLDKYHLHHEPGNINPSSNIPPKFKFHYPSTEYNHISEVNGNRYQCFETSPDEIVVVLSITESIEDQKDEIGRLLIEHSNKTIQYKEPKNISAKPNKYITYLRVFDALMEGATKIDIAKIIYPHKDHERGNSSGVISVNNDRIESESLINGKYKTLLRIPLSNQ